MSNFDFLKNAAINFLQISYQHQPYPISVNDEDRLLKGLTDAEETLLIDEKSSVNKMRTVLQDNSIIAWPNMPNDRWALRYLLKHPDIKDNLCTMLIRNRSLFGDMDFSIPPYREFHGQIGVENEYMLSDLVVSIMNFGSHGQLNVEPLSPPTDDFVNENFYSGNLAALLFFVVHYVLQKCTNIGDISTFDFSKIKVGGFSPIPNRSCQMTRSYCDDNGLDLCYETVGLYKREYNVGRENPPTSYAIIKRFSSVDYIDEVNYPSADDRVKNLFSLYRDRLECISYELNQLSPALLYSYNSRYQFLVYRLPKGTDKKDIKQLRDVITDSNVDDYIKKIIIYFSEMGANFSLLRELKSEDIWVYKLYGEEKIYYSGLEWFRYEGNEGQGIRDTLEHHIGGLESGRITLQRLIGAIAGLGGQKISIEEAGKKIDNILRTAPNGAPNNGNPIDPNVTTTESSFRQALSETADTEKTDESAADEQKAEADLNNPSTEKTDESASDEQKAEADLNNPSTEKTDESAASDEQKTDAGGDNSEQITDNKRPWFSRLLGRK